MILVDGGKIRLYVHEHWRGPLAEDGDSGHSLAALAVNSVITGSKANLKGGQKQQDCRSSPDPFSI